MAEQEILRFLGQRSGGKSGGLIVNHRFGSGLNIAPHLHFLLLDGGYEDSEAPAFHAAPPLRQEELQALATRMAHGLVRILKRHKLLADDGATAQLELDALGACTTQAMQHGTREKQGPALSLVQEDEVETPRGKLVANIDGFNLYAGPVIDGKDRETLLRTAGVSASGAVCIGQIWQAA